MEGLSCFDGGGLIARVDLLGDDGQGIAPVVTDGFDQRGNDEALDVSARRVMCAQSVALVRVERPLQQGAEDGRLNVAPTGIRRFDQEPELVAREWKCLGGFEQAAVELEDVAAEDGRETAVVHGLPKGFGHGREVADVFPQALEQVEPAALGQQSHVLGKGSEDAARQELGDGLGRVLQLQVAGEDGELAGDLAGDLGGFACGIEREGIEPDGSQPLLDRR